MSTTTSCGPVTQRQALKLVRKAKRVFVWVRYMTEDGDYFRVAKPEALARILTCPFSTDGADFLVRMDEDGDVFIN